MNVRKLIYAISIGAVLALSPATMSAAASSAQETAIKAPASVKAVTGGISIEADGQTHIVIYALTGQIVKQFDAAPGQTTVDLPAGYYIVRVGQNAVKVAVK